MDTEDVYTFYREEIDPQFAIIWSKAVENPDSCDVRLECINGQYCHCHQSLLSVISRCFEAAFNCYHANRIRELPPDEELVITMPYSVSFNELSAIITFIYNGVVSVAESRVSEFLEASKVLAINGLKDIQLLFIDDSTHLSPSQQINSQSDCQSDYQDSDDDKSLYESMDFQKDFNQFTAIKEFTTEDKIDDSKKYLMNNPIKRVFITKPEKTGLQGRRPQVGSPLITEEFKLGDRYQCKVCFRSYLWKKSLVRHYKDQHPNTVQLVTK
ncbi:uncharacterized protein LOC128959951 [Oppia nitens]|uniref:uncharacterized protein LOC128959951 n=1 Tax=Oppia nitens TaxID=1686743 RepID=UPI0023DBBCF2|nr:uncharacterized protein LOC128959951 [Oppia nitens]